MNSSPVHCPSSIRVIRRIRGFACARFRPKARMAFDSNREDSGIATSQVCRILFEQTMSGHMTAKKTCRACGKKLWIGSNVAFAQSGFHLAAQAGRLILFLGAQISWPRDLSHACQYEALSSPKANSLSAGGYSRICRRIRKDSVALPARTSGHPQDRRNSRNCKNRESRTAMASPLD